MQSANACIDIDTMLPADRVHVCLQGEALQQLLLQHGIQPEEIEAVILQVRLYARLHVVWRTSGKCTRPVMYTQGALSGPGAGHGPRIAIHILCRAVICCCSSHQYDDTPFVLCFRVVALTRHCWGNCRWRSLTAMLTMVMLKVLMRGMTHQQIRCQPSSKQNPQ